MSKKMQCSEPRIKPVLSRSAKSLFFASALGLAALACSTSEPVKDDKPAVVKVQKKVPSSQKGPATQATAPASQEGRTCDVHVTPEEMRGSMAGLAGKCGTSESETVELGGVVETANGQRAKVVKIQNGSILIAFGEKDKKDSSGKYNVVVPFLRGSGFTIMDPKMAEEGVSEKVGSLSTDLAVFICPEGKQTKKDSQKLPVVKIVKKTWGELKCEIAEAKAGKQAEAKVEELRKQVDSIKGELKNVKDPAKITEIGRKLMEASSELEQLASKKATKKQTKDCPKQTSDCPAIVDPFK